MVLTPLDLWLNFDFKSMDIYTLIQIIAIVILLETYYLSGRTVCVCAKNLRFDKKE